ncbi:MAG TPA: IPT/TIG domain-containing protein [Candidatus Limnocylindria bacterium]|jgi:hypothetical protein|nr:IPT/TIG domain-containing protein [Candidatus Limnocylindria bacterium]
MRFLRLLPLFALLGLLPLRGDTPFITSVSDNFGPAGKQIDIFGGNFASAAGLQVIFAGGIEQAAQILGGNNTHLVVTVPFQAMTGPIIVRNVDGDGYSPSDFTAAPFITSFSRIGSRDDVPGDGHRGNPFQTVNILGANFESNDGTPLNTQVYFGAVRANVDIQGPAAIVATIPASAVTGSILVINSTGGYTTSPEYFYIPPRIDFFTGKAKVGDQINLTGISLLGVTNVTIGGIRAPVFTIQGDTGTNIVATIPNNAPMSGTVSVTSAGNIYSTIAQFLLLPSITGFSVVGAAPGDSITVNGTGLLGTTNVTFGGVAATPTATTANSITVTVPIGALTGTVGVGTPNGAGTSATTFYIAPKITGFTPVQGIVGTSVTVSGVNFSAATAMTFNDVPATFALHGSTSIVANVPNGATTGPIKITGPGGTGTSGSSFVVQGPEPILTDFSPGFGGPGTIITINGQNLDTTTGVRFNGTNVATFVIISATQITTKVPVTATTGPITVINPSGQTTTASSFVVGTNADVTVSMTSTPTSPVTQADLVVNFTIRNQGPLPATAVQGTFTSSAVTAISNVDSSKGTSELSSTGALFTFGDLAPSETVTGSIRLLVLSNANFTLSMNATSGTPDGNTNNNTATLNLQSHPIVLNVSNPFADSIHLAWPAVGTNFLLEQSAGLGPVSWKVVTNTAEFDGSQYLLDLSPTNSQSYFRLRKR